MSTKTKSAITFVLLVLVVYFVRFYGNTSGVPVPEPTVQDVITESASGSYFSVYFTNPPLNTAETGIESNLIKLIDEAKVSIHTAMYELDLPAVTLALIRAKESGVAVELVYDSEQMSKPERLEILSELKSAGIPVVPDERSAFMHNKFFVIDAKTVWTGSFNYTENASHKNNENAVVFEIPELAANYEKEFAEMFSGGLFGARSPADTPYPTLQVNGIRIDNYFAPEDNVMEKVIAVVKTAQSSIDFYAFSFTDPNLGYSMSELALNDDVKIRGLFESGQDMGDSVCPYLMLRSENIEGNGAIDLKLDGNPANMHEKVIIVDGKIVIFGSFNFSRNADQNNDENLLIVHDPQFAGLFEQEFQKIYNQGISPISGCKKP